MTLEPDDLPPASGERQQLHCPCTNPTFIVLVDDVTMVIACAACKTVVAAVPAPGREAMIGPERDMIGKPLGGQAAPTPNKALLRGGPMGGRTVPVLPDVTTFMVGSGIDAIGSGAGWADTGADAVRMSGGQAMAYQDSGEREPGTGLRIFDYAGGHHDL